METQQTATVDTVRLQRPSSLSASTFAVVLIPGINTVLDPVADQRVVDAHVAVAEEGVTFTGSCGNKQEPS